MNTTTTEAISDEFIRLCFMKPLAMPRRGIEDGDGHEVHGFRQARLVVMPCPRKFVTNEIIRNSVTVSTNHISHGLLQLGRLAGLLRSARSVQLAS